MTIRYINIITIDTDKVNTADYFKIAVMIPPNISQNLQAFGFTTEHLYNGGKDVLQLTLNTAPDSDPSKISFLFDTKSSRRIMIYGILNHGLIKDIAY